MVETLEQAVAQVRELAAADQEEIGRKLLSHVEKLRALRQDIDRGIRSPDAGARRDIEDLIRPANEK